MANKRDISQPAVEIIDEQTTFTIAELCRTCAVEAEFVTELVEQGILEPRSARGRNWIFPVQSLRRTRVVVRLQRDLGVNLAGAALALDLLERIDEMDARLRLLTGLSTGDR